jgi:hypothetical protein
VCPDRPGRLRLAGGKTALEHDLRRETQFLSDFDEVYRQIDDRWDIRNPDLSNLILFAFQNRGLSKHRRKQYADRVPAAVLDEIEEAVQARLGARGCGGSDAAALPSR